MKVSEKPTDCAPPSWPQSGGDEYRSVLGDGLAFRVQPRMPSRGDVNERDLPIVVVDADPSSRELLRLLLTSHGHRVTAIDSAEAALGFLATASAKLIVVDVRLPGITGAGFIREVREVLGPPPVPIIALASDERDLRRARDAGATACHRKPVGATGFARLVGDVLTRRSAGSVRPRGAGTVRAAPRKGATRRRARWRRPVGGTGTGGGN
jgi:CheY-like chemotaxis protein